MISWIILVLCDYFSLSKTLFHYVSLFYTFFWYVSILHILFKDLFPLFMLGMSCRTLMFLLLISCYPIVKTWHWSPVKVVSFLIKLPGWVNEETWYTCSFSFSHKHRKSQHKTEKKSLSIVNHLWHILIYLGNIYLLLELCNVVDFLNLIYPVVPSGKNNHLSKCSLSIYYDIIGSEGFLHFWSVWSVPQFTNILFCLERK